MRLMSNIAFPMLALLLALPAATSTPEEPFKVTTVFLIRHAEKLTTPPGDPSLTASGKARAESLTRILSKAGIKAIFTSQFQRTKETARPLAQALRITPTVVPIQVDPSDPNKVTDQSIKDLVDRINQHSGEAVLVVGHTNTIPAVIRTLGGDAIATIPETEFDNLFVVTVYEKTNAKVVQLKY